MKNLSNIAKRAHQIAKQLRSLDASLIYALALKVGMTQSWMEHKQAKAQKMLTKKQFKKTTEKGSEIVINIEFGMKDDTINSDGDIIGIQKYVENFEIIVKRPNGDIFAQSSDINFVCELRNPNNGFMARVGDVFIQQHNWDLIKPMLDEVKQYFKQPVKFIPAKVVHGFGWCNKCESYCYGDCQAS